MNTSEKLFERAREVIPGGVNSPVRAFRGVGGNPVFMERADGACLYDVDGKEYIDYVLSWGPMILGHNHGAVREAVTRQAQRGLSFGTPTELETGMAARLCSLLPGMDLVRMVNSGTEATMTAIRLARGFTGRDKIVKFEGCYHGHSDSLLVKAGSGALTLGVPSSAGVPATLAAFTLNLDYNDTPGLAGAFEHHGDEIAAVIVEPVAGNMNCIPPAPGFLQALRRHCDEHGSVLIFDEVMTGFRLGLQGAQGYFGVQPDLTTLGKVIGGGLPVGACGGRGEIMEMIAPLGPVYQAGTLSGNPLAMAAGLATLEIIGAQGFYEPLFQRTRSLCQGLEQAAQSAGIPYITNHAGSMFGGFFTELASVGNYRQVTACDTQGFNRFFQQMLSLGIYLAPSAYEAGFLSAAHSDADIQATIAAAATAFAAL